MNPNNEISQAQKDQTRMKELEWCLMRSQAVIALMILEYPAGSNYVDLTARAAVKDITRTLNGVYTPVVKF
jgi:hypothetical protein